MTPADFVFETLQTLEVLTNPVTTKETAHKQYEYHQLTAPKGVHLLFTFFPFSLQDKIFQTGEAPSASIVYNTLQKYVEKIGIIDLHAPPTVPWVQDGLASGGLNLLSMTDCLIKEAIERYELDNPIVLSPDEGGQIRTGTQGLSKSRTNSFSVEVHGEVDVKNREVILIDDFTKSGSTLIKSKQAFLQQGAKRVISCVTHLMPLRETGESRLEQLVTKLNGEFLASNTIYTHLLEKTPNLKASCLPIIEDFLKMTDEK